MNVPTRSTPIATHRYETRPIDPSFTKNNPAGQGSDLTEKLKKDMDK